MHLTIRVDGGSEIGYGHLIRSNALAEEFLDRHHDVTVATTTPQPVRSVFPEAVTITELSSRGDPEPFVGWLKSNAPDLVFTDAYPVDTDYQRAIRDLAPLAVLQDDSRHSVDADLFINGNIYAPDLLYEFVDPVPETCLGTEYAPLRRNIRERAEDEPPWREKPERAIIMMGGSDIANLTPKAVRAFDDFDLYVDAVVGPGFSDKQESAIRAAASETSVDASVVRDPHDLAERMFQADFAVSTASSTTYELFALGTPIISVPVADNQEPIARSLRAHNAARVLERGANVDDFRRSIEMYITIPELREKYRDYGRQLVDGQGVVRIATEILSLAEDKP